MLAEDYPELHQLAGDTNRRVIGGFVAEEHEISSGTLKSYVSVHTTGLEIVVITSISVSEGFSADPVITSVLGSWLSPLDPLPKRIRLVLVALR